MFIQYVSYLVLVSFLNAVFALINVFPPWKVFGRSKHVRVGKQIIRHGNVSFVMKKRIIRRGRRIIRGGNPKIYIYFVILTRCITHTYISFCSVIFRLKSQKFIRSSGAGFVHF